MNEQTHKKVLFKYFSTYLDQIMSETMWAEVIDEKQGLFKLDNLPFFGPAIATDAIFKAEFDKEAQKWIHVETIQHSGNSIVQILILEKAFDVNELLAEFDKLDCISDSLNPTFFALEVKESVCYTDVLLLLKHYEDQGIIEFAEPIISEKHRIDVADIDQLSCN